MHVLTIIKNLVSIGQIVDQGMQVQFTHLGFFIKEEGQIITKGGWEGRMFILDTNDISITLFAKEQKVELDIDLWQTRISHVVVKDLLHDIKINLNIIFNTVSNT